MSKILIVGGCGYIGSAIYLYLKKNDYEVDTLDLELFGNNINRGNTKYNFSEILSFPIDYGTIIHLAGRSSVAMCTGKEEETFQDNVIAFNKFFRRFTQNKDTKFIYASSSSVYNGSTYEATEEYGQFRITNPYDFSKYTIDGLAKLSNKNYYGLRFGTVCGWSPNMRTDIMINKMVYCAMVDKKISVYNPLIKRPILDIKDLCRAVHKIIETKDSPGIYNIKSFNEYVYIIAQKVGKILAVPVEIEGNSDTYNFEISSRLFEAIFNFKSDGTVESIVKDIIENTKIFTPNERK